MKNITHILLSAKVERGDKYSGSSGAIIVSLITTNTSCYTKTVNYNSDETWYVVNNSDDKSYCLPVAIMQNVADISSYKMCISDEKKIMLQKIRNGVNNVTIYYFDTIWCLYEDASKKK